MDLKATILGRCPRCRKGAIFAPLLSFRMLFMNQECAVCGLHFEREEGYFLGAMYVSYALGLIAVLPVSLALVLLVGWGLVPVMVVLIVQTLIWLPLCYRYSRVIWLHVDHAFFSDKPEAGYKLRDQ